MKEARREVLARWGRGVLLDIHGQASENDAIIRGTQNGKSTTHLVKKFGEESLIGAASLFGQLADKKFPVIPPVNSGNKEHPKYNGGHIVQIYGSMKGGTLDAIQLELGRNLRHPEVNSDTAARMAVAIQKFSLQYLPREELKPSQKIRVGVYYDKGSGKSRESLLKALANFHDVTIRKLTAEEIRSGKLSEIDVLIQPGGSGGGQGRHLEESGREKIRSFLKSGGGYLGICAGAYLASADYDWSLNILDAKVVDRKHWARGKGMVELAVSKSGRNLLNIDHEQLEIYYAQGPLLAPANHPGIPDYDPLALFETEIARNGAPKGVMKGTTAIARGQFGKGRVICFSPHPELTKGLEYFIQLALRDLQRKDASQSK